MERREVWHHLEMCVRMGEGMVHVEDTTLLQVAHAVGGSVVEEDEVRTTGTYALFDELSLYRWSGNLSEFGHEKWWIFLANGMDGGAGDIGGVNGAQVIHVIGACVRKR